MRRLFVLVLLAASVATIIAAGAAAKPEPHARNGLISFTRWDPVLRQDVVYTINPDGTHEHQLLVAGESGQWSPNGTRIWLIPDCCNSQILNPDNGSVTELPTFYPDLAGGLFLPCGVWSPDGSRLACEGFGGDPGTDGVYTIRSTDGGDVQRVTSGADDDCPGDYSPDGKRIVFLRASFDLGAQGLFTVKSDGSDLRQITPDGMNLGFDCGSWSPRGNEILFAAQATGGQNAIFVVHSDGSGLRQIPIVGCGDTDVCNHPVWSPDGKKIVFTRLDVQTHESDLYTVDANGGGLFQVTHSGLGGGLTDWGTHPLNQ
jgi:Tol biopolymer transport system component